MNEEEKKAIDKLQYTIEINQNILDGIEIDEQVIKSMETTLNLIDKQQKEIEFYKIQELGYIQGYEDGKSHKQTAVAIKNENAQYELIKRVIEEKDKEIEKLKSRKYIFNAETNEIKEIPISENYISKDKIRELKEKVEKEMINNPYDFSYMINELLGE